MINLKHTWLLLLLAFILGVFFVSPAYGIIMQSYDYTSTNDVQGANGFQLWQEIEIPVYENQSPNAITLTEAGWFIRSSIGSASHTTSTVKILNSDGDELIKGHLVDSFSLGWNDITFDAPLSITTNTLASNTPAFIYFQFEEDGDLYADFGLQDSIYGSPYYGYFTATSTGSYNNLYDYWENTSPWEYPENAKDDEDLIFRFGQSTNYLSITNPSPDEYISDALTITGTCSDDVDLTLSQPYDYNHPDDELNTTATCTGDQFEWSVGYLNAGEYYLFASSTDAWTDVWFVSAGESSFYMATSSPFNTYEGGEAGFWSFILNRYNNIIDLKPFSYVYQIYSAFDNAFDNASGTSPFDEFTITASTTVPGVPEFTIPKIDHDIATDIVSQSQWDTLRTTLQIVIYLVFIYYIWRRTVSLL